MTSLSLSSKKVFSCFIFFECIDADGGVNGGQLDRVGEESLRFSWRPSPCFFFSWGGCPFFPSPPIHPSFIHRMRVALGALHVDVTWGANFSADPLHSVTTPTPARPPRLVTLFICCGFAIDELARPSASRRPRLLPRLFTPTPRPRSPALCRTPKRTMRVFPRTRACTRANLALLFCLPSRPLSPVLYMADTRFSQILFSLIANNIYSIDTNLYCLMLQKFQQTVDKLHIYLRSIILLFSFYWKYSLGPL